ncbi:Putative bactoprenol glucosyl transferase GtrB-like. Putative phage encoded seroconversion system [Vibrio harveyi]|uniref:Putative glycosyl transferase family-2 protein n=1 Tax=Vibrio harveyi TaxID=669 RepID=S5FM53_VIBHA|nr:glycosyltransferase family 2 protein [Vibrio harveyi]AGQ45490.1 putative glycosyl transferase family-2 protein [Vibrio harveyi]AGW25586.1 putative glycosyl transferase family-2 protein [Vibrio harveyi]CAK6712665.1 Putative bactoprenol glucosyl transferase GtrB-like. Putative phage encoded seroconversion system [Vibrio harveyi]
MNKSIDISVVIPCFNESECIDELYLRLTQSLSMLTEVSYEIIFINDGSKDDTWDKLTRISTLNENITAINLSRNYGHQIALTAGLKQSRGEATLIIDADLQDPPELLSSMLDKMKEGFDVVYGKRTERDGESTFKKVSASLFYRFLNQMSETKIPRDTGDFRLISRRALDALLLMDEENRFIRGMVSWIGFPQSELLYSREARFSGETKYPLKKMMRLAIDAITSFSTKPLKLASKIGFTLAFFGIIFIIKVVIDWHIGNVVTGWSSLMATILFIGSAQMFVLGIIGEYLGRVYTEAKNRPLYIIQEIING